MKRRTARYSSAARPVPRRGWTYSRWTALLFGALLLALVGVAGTALLWERLPDRVHYLADRVEARLFPKPPPPAFMPTPVGVAAPEEALESLQIEPLPQATTVAVSEPAVPAAPAAEVAPQATVVAAEDDALEAAPVAPVAQPEPTAVPAPAYAPPEAVAQLQGIRHEYQGMNNCGPATLAMQLSFWGRAETQAVTAPILKPSRDDKNVGPHEMADYARSIGFGSQVVIGADLELLRTLVTNGFPVIVESWFVPEPNDEMGHYLLLTGYDGETLKFFDSYKGPDVQEPAAEFDALWKVFNRTAIVVWSPEQAELMAAILGERADPSAMVQRAVAVAHQEVTANPQDKFAWFNLGSGLVALGDIPNAVKAFDTARSLELPWRMLWYQFTPYEAYFANGQYQQVVDLATTTLNGAGNLEESLVWRGRALAALGQSDAARRDFQQALQVHPGFAPAQNALAGLP